MMERLGKYLKKCQGTLKQSYLKHCLMLGGPNLSLVFDNLNTFVYIYCILYFLSNKTNIFLNFKTETRTLPFNTI